MWLRNRFFPFVIGFYGLALLFTAGLSSAAEETLVPWSSKPQTWLLSTPSMIGVTSSLALSPDYEYLAVGWSTGEILLLDPEDGAIVRTWQAHDGRVNAVVFLPKDRQLISASDDGTIKFWHLHGGDAVATLTDHSRWVTSLAFGDSACWLASGSYDRTARIWNLETKSSEPRVFQKHDAGIKCVDLTRDGRLLVTAGGDRTAMVWNRETEQPLVTLTGHRGAIRAVRFSPDGTLIATASEDGTARIWNSETGERMKTLTGHAGMVCSLAWFPDGNTMATGGLDHTVRFWNSQTGKRTEILRGPTTPVIAIVLNSNATQMFVASQEPSIYCFRKSPEEKEIEP